MHRSGRTARAGADGAVIALVTPEQRQTAASLLRTLGLDVTDADGARISVDAGSRGARPPKDGQRRGAQALRRPQASAPSGADGRWPAIPRSR